MMMFTSLLPVLLLSVRILQVVAQSRTYRATDPSTGAVLECEQCPPGTFRREDCTSTRGTQCASCPEGSFTELWNYIPKCLRCGVCALNQVVKTPCAPNADCKCECKAGYYYKESYEMCLPHRRCQAGEGVLTEGSPDNDTVCQVCANGSYSDTVSAHDKCKVHKSCDAAGLKLLLKGSTWHDSVCAKCGNLNSKDGGDYLKEILPAFFLHHNINIKRLGRIVQKLDGKHTETSRMSLSDLHAQINAWVVSATASHIRKLPEILKKAGLDHAGERLHNKLQRIDCNLNELRTLGSKVVALETNLL